MTARSLVAALAFAFALVPIVSSATVVMQLSMEQLTARATLVVRGTVEGARAVSKEDGSIWTVTSLIVTERLKGVGISKVTIKQPGGSLGGMNQSVSGTALFTEGEDVLLFLEPAADEKNSFVVLGMASGKVSFEVVNGQKMAVRHLDGVSFAKAGSRQIERVENLERLGTVERFLSRIRIAAAPPSAPAATAIRGVK